MNDKIEQLINNCLTHCRDLVDNNQIKYENMFKNLDENSTTIKVGIKKTHARFYIDDPHGVVSLLDDINTYLK